MRFTMVIYDINLLITTSLYLGRVLMVRSCYITFPTTFFAIRAESLLKKFSYPYKMVPVPRVISSSCGTALRCDCENIRAIRDYLLENKLKLESYYRLEEEGLKISGVEELILDE